MGLKKEDGSNCANGANLPVILGEVANRQGDAENNANNNDIAYRHILDTAVQTDVGYLIWNYFNDVELARNTIRRGHSGCFDANDNCGLFRDDNDLTDYGKDVVRGITVDAGDIEPRNYRLEVAGKTLSMHKRNKSVDASADAVNAFVPDFNVGGQQRKFFYSRPNGTAATGGRPVVIWLHGDTNSAADAANAAVYFSGVTATAANDRPVVIMPVGTNSPVEAWNIDFSAGASTNDADFIRALVAKLKGNGNNDADFGPINPKRISIWGESRGGNMAYSLVMDRARNAPANSNVYSGLGVNAGSIDCGRMGNNGCDGSFFAGNPIGVIHVHGEMDAAANGGVDPPSRNGAFPMRAWAVNNPAPPCYSFQDMGSPTRVAPYSGNDVEVFDFSKFGCPGSKYVLELDPNGGHVLPEADREIWNFLRLQRLP